jgi:hypothetical protein
MKKQVWLAIVGLFLVGMVAVPLFGCAKTAKTLGATISDVSTLGSSEVTISGTAKTTSSGLDINLNPVLVGGSAITLDSSKVKVRVSKVLTGITTLSAVTVTFPAASSKPLDIVFISDNTGSMYDSITGVKNSILDFALSLEAAGIDAKFGLVTFGDSAIHPTPTGEVTAEGGHDDGNSLIRPVMDFGTAAQLKVVGASVEAAGGSDTPENPLDAIMYGYNHLTWRSGAQKIFIVITDSDAHQKVAGDTSSDNLCTTSGEAVISSLAGKAVIYSVSENFTYSLSPYLDVRRLADGLGEGRTTPESNTGGKWIQFVSSGFDLNKLGIDTALSKSYTLRFDVTIDEGVWYVYVQIDTDGDGVFDSNALIKLTIAATSKVKSSSVSSELSGFTTFGNGAGAPVTGLKAGVPKPNK